MDYNKMVRYDDMNRWPKTFSQPTVKVERMLVVLVFLLVLWQVSIEDNTTHPTSHPSTRLEHETPPLTFPDDVWWCQVSLTLTISTTTNNTTSLPLPVCLSVCRSFSSRVCVFDLLSVTLCVCLPFCLFVCHSVWFCLCLFFCIPVIVALLVCLSFCQKFEHFCLLVSDCVCLFAVLPDYLPASLPSITFTPYCLGNELWGYDEDVCMYVYMWEEKVRDSFILRIHLSSSTWRYTLWSRR